MSIIHVVLVDDHPFVRTGIRNILVEKRLENAIIAVRENLYHFLNEPLGNSLP
jgi:DNA-binding NarL/FixJ family response regulator